MPENKEKVDAMRSAKMEASRMSYLSDSDTEPYVAREPNIFD